MSGIAQAQNFLTAAATEQSSYFADGETEQQYTSSNTTSINSTTGSCGGSCLSCDPGCECLGNWRDNTLVWFGADAYKSLGDTFPPPGPGNSFMNSAGVVAGFNTGFALGESLVRAQIGASYGVYDFLGRDTNSPSSAEQQTFVTAGFYKRSDILNGDRISWGVVYDQFFAHQWGLFASELYVSQVRAIVGYALSEWNEVGFWGAWHTNSDNSVGGIAPPPVRTMNQFNAYWRHNWDFGGSTMAYVGAADPADIASWLLGVLGQAPLSDNVSLYGNVTFAFPGSATGFVGSNELEWNLGAGLVYSFGGKAVSPTVSGQRGLPLLPVANNGSMLITN